jgi:uncharacterized cupredoxin-like copper-binding protein
VLLGLSTSHEIGLATMGGIFIVFALVSSFLLPRARPEFPGRYLGPFVALCVLLFLGMLSAVEIFGGESEKASAAEAKTETTPTSTAPGDQANDTSPATTSAGGIARTIQVTERDFKIELPTKTLSEGKYAFDVKNAGQTSHDLVISGPQVSNVTTPVFGPGKSVKLTVSLVKGTYKFYCSVPGHEQLGMKLEVTVS